MSNILYKILNHFVDGDLLDLITFLVSMILVGCITIAFLITTVVIMSYIFGDLI